MALAKLCINLKTSKDVGDFRNFQFQALIVDHKARKGSDVEARKVRQSLKIMGITFDSLLSAKADHQEELSLISCRLPGLQT